MQNKKCSPEETPYLENSKCRAWSMFMGNQNAGVQTEHTVKANVGLSDMHFMKSLFTIQAIREIQQWRFEKKDLICFIWLLSYCFYI